jgi:hypothetical protein
MGQVSRGAGELVGQALSDRLPLSHDEALAPDIAPVARAIAAPAPSRCAALDDVYALVQEADLERHLEPILSLCRWSLRLTPPMQARATQTAAAQEPQPREDESAPCAVELDLAALPELGEPGLLPSGGVLRIFVDDTQSLPQTICEHTRACTVVWSPPPATAASTATASSGHPLELAPELQLPRVWSDPVQRLGLEPPEIDAWERIRDRLAGIQGVVPFDSSPEPESLHRILGYPDERQGNMPLACEMLAHHVDFDDAPAAAHPRAQEFEAGAARWLLLAQLSDDQRIDWSWGGGDERVYVWIHASDLAARDFSSVIAFTQ